MSRKVYFMNELLKKLSYVYQLEGYSLYIAKVNNNDNQLALFMSNGNQFIFKTFAYDNKTNAAINIINQSVNLSIITDTYNTAKYIKYVLFTLDFNIYIDDIKKALDAMKMA